MVTKISLGTQSTPHAQLNSYSMFQESTLTKNKALKNGFEVYIICRYV